MERTDGRAGAGRARPLWEPAAAAAVALLLLSPAGRGAGPGARTGDATGHEEVRGVTISCQTWGWEWGTDGFAEELDELRALGANWVSIHPYARIEADGSLRWRPVDPEDPPVWLARPLAEARARGLEVLVKPHLAYWGSPFRWRGEIDFAEPEALARFHASYREWTLELARATRGAAAFCVGTELDRLTGDAAYWRGLIREVRATTPARLTYAANWDRYAEVPFWDELDAVGIQAYFPLSPEEDPDVAALRSGWEPVLEELAELHRRTGKPVVFTELGYDCALGAASEPWAPRGACDERGRALQERCLATALEVLGEERAWLRGAFLWKWFVGEARREDFRLQRSEVREVLARSWAR